MSNLNSISLHQLSNFSGLEDRPIIRTASPPTSTEILHIANTEGFESATQLFENTVTDPKDQKAIIDELISNGDYALAYKLIHAANLENDPAYAFQLDTLKLKAVNNIVELIENSDNKKTAKAYLADIVNDPLFNETDIAHILLEIDSPKLAAYTLRQTESIEYAASILHILITKDIEYARNIHHTLHQKHADKGSKIFSALLDDYPSSAIKLTEDQLLKNTENAEIAENLNAEDLNINSSTEKPSDEYQFNNIIPAPTDKTDVEIKDHNDQVLSGELNEALWYTITQDPNGNEQPVILVETGLLLASHAETLLSDTSFQNLTEEEKEIVVSIIASLPLHEQTKAMSNVLEIIQNSEFQNVLSLEERENVLELLAFDPTDEDWKNKIVAFMNDPSNKSLENLIEYALADPELQGRYASSNNNAPSHLKNERTTFLLSELGGAILDLVADYNTRAVHHADDLITTNGDLYENPHFVYVRTNTGDIFLEHVDTVESLTYDLNNLSTPSFINEDELTPNSRATLGDIKHHNNEVIRTGSGTLWTDNSSGKVLFSVTLFDGDGSKESVVSLNPNAARILLESQALNTLSEADLNTVLSIFQNVRSPEEQQTVARHIVKIIDDPSFLNLSDIQQLSILNLIKAQPLDETWIDLLANLINDPSQTNLDAVHQQAKALGIEEFTHIDLVNFAAIHNSRVMASGEGHLLSQQQDGNEGFYVLDAYGEVQFITTTEFEALTDADRLTLDTHGQYYLPAGDPVVLDSNSATGIAPAATYVEVEVDGITVIFEGDEAGIAANIFYDLYHNSPKFKEAFQAYMSGRGSTFHINTNNPESQPLTLGATFTGSNALYLSVSLELFGRRSKEDIMKTMIHEFGHLFIEAGVTHTALSSDNVHTDHDHDHDHDVDHHHGREHSIYIGSIINDLQENGYEWSSTFNVDEEDYSNDASILSDDHKHQHKATIRGIIIALDKTPPDLDKALELLQKIDPTEETTLKQIDPQTNEESETTYNTRELIIQELMLQADSADWLGTDGEDNIDKAALTELMNKLVAEDPKWIETIEHAAMTLGIDLNIEFPNYVHSSSSHHH